MTEFGRLADRFARARRDPSLVVLEGFHALKHALRFGAEVVEAVTADPARVRGLAERLAPDLLPRLRTGDDGERTAGHVALRSVPPDLFRELAPHPPETRVIGLARRPAVDAERVLADPAPAPIVYLEHPTRLGNLGAAVRVAAAAGAAGVLTSGTHDPWHPAAVRGAAGLHFALPVARIDGLPATDRPLIGIDPGGEPLRAGLLPRRAILAFGSERRGLEPATLEACARRIGIPMRAGVSSLNLATAVAVALYVGLLGDDAD